MCSCGHFNQRCHNSPRWETGLHSANELTHRKRSEDFGRFWKSQLVELRLDTGRDGWLSLASGGLGKVSHEMGGGGADEKARIERLCLSLSLSLVRSKKTLNSKVIKSFVLELRSRKCFSCFEIPMFYVIYKWTFCISVSGYGAHFFCGFKSIDPHQC